MATKEKALTLKVVKCHKDAKIPVKKKTQTDSGFDVFADNFKRYYKNFGTNGVQEYEGDDIDDYTDDSFIPDTGWCKSLTLSTNERVLVGVGIKATVAEGYEIQVRSRSGVALKRGLIVTNGIGTIDFEYTGEIGVIITNTSNEPQTIILGEAIAQIVPIEVLLPEIEILESFEDSKRGDAGYGSTGTV